jgi:hypothetical protein
VRPANEIITLLLVYKVWSVASESPTRSSHGTSPTENGDPGYRRKPWPWQQNPTARP